MVETTPLTPSERALIERHLPLVRLQLARQIVAGRDPATRDDLFQEGCLALAEAVRKHCPQRHGQFAPYALARIHCAMGAYLRERTELVRVPLATQKRRARQASRHDPSAAPPGWRPPRRQTVWLEGIAGRPEQAEPRGVRIGDLMRVCIESAARQAERAERSSRRRAAGSAELVRRIVAERVRVPEPEAAASIRGMAREMGLSLGRVTHTEARLRRRMRALLERDRLFRLLRWLSRRRGGSDAALGAVELAWVGTARRRQRAHTSGASQDAKRTQAASRDAKR